MILSAWDFWASVINVEPLNALATFSAVAVISWIDCINDAFEEQVT
jgi:hypothetical protein